MRFGKRSLFLFLHGLIAAGFLIYYSAWIFSRTTDGTIIRPYYSSKVHVQYTVAGKMYAGEHMRFDIPYSRRVVSVRYLTYRPSVSRISSFMGMWAEPLAWWGTFMLATAVLLLMDNAIFTKGTVFRLHRKFPWISMEEYFPLPWWFRNRNKREEPARHAAPEPSGPKGSAENKRLPSA